MHVVAPQPPGGGLKMFFNVDASVGANAANTRQDDILLVQFLIRKIAEGGVGGGITPDRQARMLRVPTSGVCDPATIDGIRAAQEAAKTNTPGTIVDGRVSVARGYTYGKGFFTITTLNTSIRDFFPRVWPRLQDFPDCPPQLKLRVQDVL